MNRIFLIVVAYFALWSQSNGQITLNVPSLSFPTIQLAIDGAANGDIVNVAAGTYIENLIFPSKDFHLIGAGPGQTIIDGNQNGACLHFGNVVTNSMIVEGMTLTNGTGSLVLFGIGFDNVGGGVTIIPPASNVGAGQIAPTIKNCEITNNEGDHGSGIFVRFAGDAVFQDCRVHSNGNLSFSESVIQIESTTAEIKFENCVIENNSSMNGIILYTTYIVTSNVTFSTSKFKKNVGFTVSAILNSGGGDLSIDRCSFIENIAVSQSNGLTIGGLSTSQLAVENSLFAKNTGGVGILQITPGAKTIRNCTFVDNTLFNGMWGVVVFGNLPANPQTTLTVENSIFSGNRDAQGSPIVGPYVTPGTSYTEVNSIVESPANFLTFTPPSFLDELNGDYRLAPNSIGIDGGATNGLVPQPTNLSLALDLNGNARVQLDSIDIGCYEAGDIAYHSSANGRVGLNSGGPYDTLQINGSSGDIFRTVVIPLGISSSVTMVQPPNLASPAGFAIFGLIGKANEQTITNVPLGIGDMTFPPCPVLPTHPALFTLTNNLGTFCPQLVSSTPTSWTSAPFPPIFFPLTLTFQGVIEESPGVYVPTNMVIYETK